MTEHDRISNLLQERAAELPEAADFDVPPRVFLDMDGKFLDYQPDQSLTARFPFKTRYQNPMRTMQGGIIVAAIDNVIGPLSFLVAAPNATTHLDMTYIRPITTAITVTGRVVEVTRNHIYLSAEVRDESGKLCALCNATHRFIIM